MDFGDTLAFSLLSFAVVFTGGTFLSLSKKRDANNAYLVWTVTAVITCFFLHFVCRFFSRLFLIFYLALLVPVGYCAFFISNSETLYSRRQIVSVSKGVLLGMILFLVTLSYCQGVCHKQIHSHQHCHRPPTTPSEPIPPTPLP